MTPPHPATCPIDVRFSRSGLISPRAPLAEFTRGLLGGACDLLGWPGAGVSVLYCSESGMRRLNRDFRAIDKPTDVLSFPAADDVQSLRDDPHPCLGDLAICLPYTARAAKAAGRKLNDEVALLLVHGLLHLLGWDHDTKAREKKMWREQERLLRELAWLKRPAVRVKPGK